MASWSCPSCPEFCSPGPPSLGKPFSPPDCMNPLFFQPLQMREHVESILKANMNQGLKQQQRRCCFFLRLSSTLPSLPSLWVLSPHFHLPFSLFPFFTLLSLSLHLRSRLLLGTMGVIKMAGFPLTVIPGLRLSAAPFAG